MLRSAASKVIWVGRATVFMVGLAVIVGLVLGLASMALGADADFFRIGRLNEAAFTSTLDKSGAGPALSLRVDRGAPLAVNRQARVANLNADLVDGKHAAAFLPNATYRKFEGTTGTFLPSSGRTQAAISCDEGDVVLSGGYHDVDVGTTIVGSQPLDPDMWELGWINDGTADQVVVSIVCADLGTPHTP